MIWCCCRKWRSKQLIHCWLQVIWCCCRKWRSKQLIHCWLQVIWCCCRKWRSKQLIHCWLQVISWRHLSPAPCPRFPSRCSSLCLTCLLWPLTTGCCCGAWGWTLGCCTWCWPACLSSVTTGPGCPCPASSRRWGFAGSCSNLAEVKNAGFECYVKCTSVGISPSKMQGLNVMSSALQWGFHPV